jgi:hypothetical protein
MRRLAVLAGAAVLTCGLVLSATVAAQAATAAPPAAPNRPAQIAATRNSVTLIWGPVAGATGYHVFVDGNQAATSATNLVTVTGLREATLYHVAVSAFNASGESARSPEGLAHTFPFVDPPPPPH